VFGSSSKHRARAEQWGGSMMDAAYPIGFISDIDPGSLPPFCECAFRAAPGVSSPISEVTMIEAFVA
jgi:hypothetical protein